MHQRHSRRRISLATIGARGIDYGARRGRWRRSMREDVREALAIDASSTLEDRMIDITTTGRLLSDGSKTLSHDA